MLFSLVVLLAYTTIGQKQVDKFIDSRTLNTSHTRIDGKQNLHTRSSCNVMVGTCSMVLPNRGDLLPCRHQVLEWHLKAKEPAIAMETLGTDC